jgi:ribonuclease HI
MTRTLHVFLTKREHDRYMSQNDDFMLETDDAWFGETDDVLSWETKEFRKGYQNAIMQFQKKYNLRNKEAHTEAQQTNPIRKPLVDTPSTSRPRPDNMTKDATEKAKSKEEAPKKTSEASREVGGKEVEKVCPPFNFEHEMAKIKIFVPFNELIRKGEYREKIIKMLKMGGTPDTLNVQDDHPAILFGLRVEETSDTEDVPPFYVSLKVHDMTLHNTMLDLGASHNLMPKVIMDELGLDITRPYKDLFSFDSRKVKCLGLIKDLVMSLAQIPSKNMVMDVVMADIPPKFGMLLSRSWVMKLKGTLQMDMSYATIPIFGQDRRLYREVLLKYMVRSKTQPNNHPIYSIDTEVGSSIFYNDLSFEEEESTTIMTTDEETTWKAAECTDPKDHVENEIWNMSFDGVVSKEGVGVDIWVSPPEVGTKLCSYKLVFECTNNMAEYEALILGLKVLKELGAKKIAVHGDSELVINQVKGIYQEKHPRLRAYRNLGWISSRNSRSTICQLSLGRKTRSLMHWPPRPRFSKSPSSLTENMRSKSDTGRQYLIISNIGRCLKMTNRWRGFSK